MGKSVEIDTTSMKFLLNHLYEYRKGVRQLFMMTMGAEDAPQIQRRLETESIEYYVHEVNASKVNVFFGKPAWVETARNIVTKPLGRLSPEEDFILGTLLGYDKEQQCLRFLAMAKPGRRRDQQAAAAVA